MDMAENLGKRYTQEKKEAVLKRMMPPNNEKISAISKEQGITEATLYKWRKEAREKGIATPGDGQVSEKWSSQDKFLVVLETFTMNEAEMGAYCRKKGLYKEQIKAWQATCLNANGSELNLSKQLNQELKEERKKTKTVEKDLIRKEKALAEAAALLLLRKKAQAIWGDQEDG